MEVDSKFNNVCFDENLFIQNEKLPYKKNSIEKELIIDKEWDNNNKLKFLINDCINIENKY